ncbi:MAG: hypothetical protein QOD55_2286 [Solirubrobacteraceae bacterium]|jgi:hypothetical protein|nr:hypothetical protein [Solirubrobacteraceae bacterium]MEA2290289.1 hypothetical protein [Solirubrobacteraceae bacterium]
MRVFLLSLVAAVALVALLPTAGASAATCADHPNQAAAQRAQDTRDADGDGIYCESNPCPCLTGGSTAPKTTSPKPKREATKRRGSAICVRTARVQPIGFSGTKYPTIRQHFLDAVAAGAPRILTLNRPGADGRRDRVLAPFPTRRGMDRDEYPPAVGRRTWRASVAYAPSSENRSHGSTLGIKLRRFCDGTRFRYVFY